MTGVRKERTKAKFVFEAALEEATEGNMGKEHILEVWEAENDSGLLRGEEGVGEGVGRRRGGGVGGGRAAEGVKNRVEEDGKGRDVVCFGVEDFLFGLKLLFSFFCKIFANLGRKKMSKKQNTEDNQQEKGGEEEKR